MHQQKYTQITNIQANMTPTKESNKDPVTDLKYMEIYELSDKTFKIIILRKLSEMQENTDM